MESSEEDEDAPFPEELNCMPASATPAGTITAIIKAIAVNRAPDSVNSFLRVMLVFAMFCLFLTSLPIKGKHFGWCI
jgi:K+-transporting ATPase A subunit